MERAILVALQHSKMKLFEVEESLSELARLAQTAGAVPEIKIIQKKNSIDPAYFIGQGKAAEISQVARENNIKTVIFDEDLKPAQQKNLTELMQVKIVDRTRLILDIFAQRARTKEGQIQVELAQLSYLLPRITEKFGTFEQQTGGARGGIGTRGPGERKLEVDQRVIRDRIAELNRDIEQIRKKRQIVRQRRIESGNPTVAIVGYTNAGKSTLLNTISKNSTVYADDKLFATLDPTTHKVKLPGGRIVLFTDTVGFIKKLPHSLVAAFRATLEEITSSHCILHLVDASSPDYRKQMATTVQVLKELEADHIPVVTAYNKSDLLGDQQYKRIKREGVFVISAKTNKGVLELLSYIEKLITPKMEFHSFLLPYDKTDKIGKIFNLALVKKQEYLNTGIKMKVKCSKEQWEIIKNLK